MANLVFNYSLGRACEFFNRVDSSDPTNAVLVLIAYAIAGDQAARDAIDITLRDAATIAAVEAITDVDEVTNAGYARILLDDTDVAFVVDTTNDRVDLDFADQTFPTVSAGDNWTDLVIAYDPDSTGGTDADIIPMSLHDFPVPPDGSDIVTQLGAAGFFRATE